jgi:tRNA-binding EMAP/Myf-like protein
VAKVGGWWTLLAGHAHSSHAEELRAYADQRITARVGLRSRHAGLRRHRDCSPPQVGRGALHASARTGRTGATRSNSTGITPIVRASVELLRLGNIGDLSLVSHVDKLHVKRAVEQNDEQTRTILCGLVRHDAPSGEMGVRSWPDDPPIRFQSAVDYDDGV